MSRFARPLALAAVCGLAMFCTACGSNNKGKIEGKWKISELPNSDGKSKGEFEQMAKLGLFVYFEFNKDNTLNIGIGSDKPELMELLKANAGQKTSWTAKYKLLSGDKVEFYDLPKDMQEDGGGGLFGKNKDKARTKIKISGDTMTMTDDDGKTGKLTKMQ